ncbi:MAG TPA: CheR family methyltransferase, partial [Ramlibacter sp.]|nr:CheR family methyltransferase [Ramlibacter sp.]
MAGIGLDQPPLLTDHDFERVRRLIHQYAGISLSEHKRNMVYNRLARRLRASGHSAFARYLDLVQSERSQEREAFVNALTTNLTAFFREAHHFDLLAARAREWRKPNGAPLRVWSSACSTGEEPWSIAMVLHEASCPGQVLATDIDSEVLAAAQEGVYAAERTASLTAERLRRYFLRGTGSNEGLLRIRPELRSMIKFAQFNLQAPAWPRGQFDVIFCRNVVIYFDR